MARRILQDIPLKKLAINADQQHYVDVLSSRDLERMKLLSYQAVHAGSYFWRTYTGAELDYVEERDGQLHGYEFKYGSRKPKAPQSWLDTYANASYAYVNQDNFHSFAVANIEE